MKRESLKGQCLLHYDTYFKVIKARSAATHKKDTPYFYC